MTPIHYRILGEQDIDFRILAYAKKNIYEFHSLCKKWDDIWFSHIDSI